MIVNSSQGGGSKDTWVLDDDSQADLAPGTLPRTQAAAAARRALRRLARPGPAAATAAAARAAMLARIAQELFWLGRDLTRAEHTARMLDGAFHADVAGAPGRARDRAQLGGECWRSSAPSRRLRARRTRSSPSSRLPTSGRRSRVARLLTLDTDSPASVVSCVARARERGRTMRDVISTEMWEALNSFYLLLGRYDLQAALRTGPYSVYQEVKEHCALFWGLFDRTMLRDEGRAFLEAGGRIEEADMVLRMLRVAVPPSPGSTTAMRARRWRCCRRSAASRPTGAPSATRRRSCRWSGSCCYDRPTPARSRSRSRRCRDALSAADAQPRSSPPVLRLERLIADLELQRRSPEAGGGLLETSRNGYRVSSAHVDRDIDDRYFAIAALAAVICSTA